MKESPSFFWPLTFIVAGIVWLLITMNVIPAANLWALTHVWPYLLIALGLGLILRSFWKPFGGIITLLAVLGVLGAVVFAPRLDWADAPNLDWSVNNNSGGAVMGSGVTATETRPVSGFDAIQIRFPAEVTITQGKTESLTIEADDNLLPQLATTVRSRTLVIENTEPSWSKRVNPKSDVVINIVVEDLGEVRFSSAGTVVIEDLSSDELYISLSGAGEVILSNLKANELTVDVSGAGSIDADGEVGEVNINISGFGNFDGKGLACQVAGIEISGAGSASLRVEKTLNAQISGAGSVNYYGDPNVTRQVSGAGSVNKAGD